MSEDRSTLATLLDATATSIRNYVVVSPEQADACALWVAHTHAIEAFRITPYLNVSSAIKQAGKTRLLETLRPLVATPVDTDGITPAALLRLVDQERPTLLLDEADAAFGGSNELAEALRGILNSGFRSRGKFMKCEGDKHNLRTFSTYCAKAIAGIGRLPDTVADRSIPIRLHRRAPGERVAEFHEDEWEDRGGSIGAGLAAELAGRIEELRHATPKRPRGLSDRAQDGWKALLSIAELAGGDWPDRGRTAAETLGGGNPELDEQEVAVRLIAALRDAYETNATNRLTTHEFLDYLHAQEDEPWADWSRGNPISARRVADLLRPFEIKPRVMRVGSETKRGYELRACEDAFARYLQPPTPSNRNTRNNGSSKPETANHKAQHEPSMLHFENREKPYEQASVTDVSLPEPDTGANGAQGREDAEIERLIREAEEAEREAAENGIGEWYE